MLELLKRFEEDAAEDDTALFDDNDSDDAEDDLAAQLDSIDLGTSHHRTANLR